MDGWVDEQRDGAGLGRCMTVPDLSNTESGNRWPACPSFLTRATWENHLEPLFPECIRHAQARPKESEFQEWWLVMCLWERPQGISDQHH